MHSAINWILVVGGAVLILIEIVLGAATGFDLLLIGSAVLLGGLLGLITHSAAMGLATAGVLSVAYVAFGRRRIRGRLQRHGLSTNTDALIGREATVVLTPEKDRAGRIRLDGEEWRARLDTVQAPGGGALAVGSQARITRVDGVTVYVVPQSPAAPSKEVHS